jgi:DNA-binding NtrC family response regulator
MPRVDGLEVIKALHLVRPQLPVILISGFLPPELVIEAEGLGAYGCLAKPLDPADCLSLVEKAVNRKWGPGTAVPTDSRAMQNVCKQIGLVAATQLTVLIRGEPGSGKGSVAHLIHEHSGRAKGPFVAVDCAEYSEGMLYRELSGDAAGGLPKGGGPRAGRLAEANHGTLFLYGIADLTLRTQAELLGALEDQRIKLGGDSGLDVRIIAATHRNLEVMVANKQFREDLYHRLAEDVIHMAA